MRWLIALLFSIPAFGEVPTPTATGPIPVTAKPGDPSRNYPYFSTAQFLPAFDYVEEEFYVEGRAIQYVGQGPQQTAKPSDGGPYPYKTRVIVHRPKSAAKFNGIVILEWTHGVVNQDSDWYWSHEHLMRRGFAHVGATVGTQGIDSRAGLKQWNPSRYGSLNVNAGGKFDTELNNDIFSQVAQALKRPGGVTLLRDLKVKNIIATGHSRSAGGLVSYFNLVQPLTGLIDGFVFHSGGAALRMDLKTPTWKLLSEAEMGQPQQPDTPYFRMWQVAGAAHADWDLMAVLDVLYDRDLGDASEEQCERPSRSRIPAHLVHDAVYDWMKVWIEQGQQPPHAPPLKLASAGTGKENPSVAARDENGNALGGIQLAQFAVPTATNTALNGPGCNIFGSHEPFNAAKLARLYPSHERYLAEVDRITDANLKAGYITKEGAEWTKQQARQSNIGRK